VSLWRRLRAAVHRGVEIRIAGLEARMQLGRAAAALRSGPRLELACARELERRFPALRDFELPLDEETAEEVLAFYHAFVPLVHEPARSAHTRTLLHRLRAATPHAALGAAAERAIAVSNLAQGLPDRARSLREDPRWSSAWRREVEELERAYGAALVDPTWSGSRRGNALRLYFEARPDLLTGRAVLHWAPELELRAWLTARGSELGIERYVTMDGFHSGVDAMFDITNIGVSGASFDLVICHRVFEHVLHDAAAFAELHRLLRPGGILHLSVPQAVHRAETAEWVVPDESHNGHVRHYGRDLEHRLLDAGFASVELDPWLLEQPESALRNAGAYPMRIYLARR
jgi:SAM-dependent methyltransferase